MKAERPADLLLLAERRLRALRDWDTKAERRDEKSVTWSLARPDEEVEGYFRMSDDGIAEVRIIYWVGSPTNMLGLQPAVLPEPLVGEFNVQHLDDEQVHSLSAVVDMAIPNRLESVLEHFASIIRHRTDADLSVGDAALGDLKQTLRAAELPVPAVARELSSLTRLGPWW